MMNNTLKLEGSLSPEITDRIIDQISIINGYVQIVLLRYSGDSFLTECLTKISNSADVLTEHVLGIGDGPATIVH